MSKEIVPEEVNPLALKDEELDDMFGGPEVEPPINVAWPEIKLTKTSDFKMSDDSKVQEIECHLVWVQRSMAYWEAAYDGSDNPPDCASDNAVKPNADIEQPQSKLCGDKLCPKATWRKKEDGSGNCVDCSESLNVILYLDGLPHYMRVRSTSMGRKSPLAKFFVNCLKDGYALRKKYQTVRVKLTLMETKINNFDTSILQVEKLSVLASDDPLLPTLIEMFKKAKEEFVIVHQGVVTDDEPDGEYESRDYEDDETPI